MSDEQQVDQKQSAVARLTKFYFDKILKSPHKTEQGEKMKLNEEQHQQRQQGDMFWGKDFLQLDTIQSDEQLERKYNQWLGGIPKNDSILFLRMAMHTLIERNKEIYTILEPVRSLTIQHQAVMKIILMPFWKRWWNLMKLRRQIKSDVKKQQKKEKIRKFTEEEKNKKAEEGVKE